MVICLLHFNELPFQPLCQCLDSKSKGPTSLKGPIGEKLSDCKNGPVIAFKSIECHIPLIDRSVPKGSFTNVKNQCTNATF